MVTITIYLSADTQEHTFALTYVYLYRMSYNEITDIYRLISFLSNKNATFHSHIL